MDDPSTFSLLQDILALLKSISTNAALRLEHGIPFSPQKLKIMLEAESRLKAVSREFSILMNAWRPVSRIPAEILAHIFNFIGRGTMMLPISYVCRRWRQVALATSSLWTWYKTFNERLWLPVLLERSAGRSLDVEIVVPARAHVPTSFLEPLVSLEGRTNSLVLWISRSPTCSEGLSQDILDAFRKFVFPGLRSLTVIDNQTVHEPLDQLWFGNIGEAEPLQNLRDLCLHRIAFKKLSTGLELCTHLQTVVLWNVEITQLILLGLVYELNSLEILALIQLDIVNGFDFSLTANIMTPSRLRFLRLDARLGDPSTSLDSYHLLNLMLRDFEHPELVGLYLDLEDAFEDRPARTESPERTIDGMYMLCIESHGQHIEFRASDGVSFYKLSWSSSQIREAITPDGLLLDATLCRLTSITHLSLSPDGDSWFRGVEWSALFSVLPSLEVLRYSGRPYRLRKILRVLACDDAEDTAVLPRAAHIKELAIEHLSDHFDDYEAELEAFLQQRMSSGHPIQRLELLDGTEWRRSISLSKFQPYVGSVVVLQKWPYGKTPVPEHFLDDRYRSDGVVYQGTVTHAVQRTRDQV